MTTQNIQELFDREAIKEVRARFAQALDFRATVLSWNPRLNILQLNAGIYPH